MKILSIDPGNQESGYAVVDSDTRRPLHIGKIDNENLVICLGPFVNWHSFDTVAIEMISSYGMPVGKEVFESCVWIGRFQQSTMRDVNIPVQLIYRSEVKLHHCGSRTAKDRNVVQALIDRFAPGATNFGKGTNAKPGWFHGFQKDIWQAYALGVTLADRFTGPGPKDWVTPDEIVQETK